ncbi:tRNA uridine-5-carboxymethylaminomethyl(34) synthesis GTPase MnmE, partial [Candidatus Sumerlaeota bacterium]|nr:tRNA uridine-5-carboxymethylaminomethyl(34) synthesis GTPase MnmE [Candidatus Sumerlaeota bacterium]
MPASDFPDLHRRSLIAARATAPGAGAIAIVRVDGEGVEPLIRSMFSPRGGTHPADDPRRAILGDWINPEGDILDEGITIFFRAPHSFTGNDLAEFHCHGGEAVVRSILSAAARHGARPAAPGEFTRRAFLNGKLDLAQAEAIADLIRAETDAAARSARAQLAGKLSMEVERIRQQLIALAAEIEARIDFPDEGIEEADLARLTHDFNVIRDEIARLLDSRRRGKLLRDGARAALVGPPNVGKSSLLNALARSDRAIVTPHPGTTRDTIECAIDLGGIALTLIDTAGLRDSDEPIEKLGIERSRRAIEEADLVIEVRDATGKIAPMDRAAIGPRAPDVVVENKVDLCGKSGRSEGSLSGAHSTNPPCAAVSALTGRG